MKSRRVTPSSRYFFEWADLTFGRNNSSKAKYNTLGVLDIAEQEFVGYNWEKSSVNDLHAEYNRLIDKGDLMVADTFFNYVLINQAIDTQVRHEFLQQTDCIGIDSDDTYKIDNFLEHIFLCNMQSLSTHYNFNWNWVFRDVKKKEAVKETKNLPAISAPIKLEDIFKSQKIKQLKAKRDEKRREKWRKIEEYMQAIGL